jgi:hypothetical protein
LAVGVKTGKHAVSTAGALVLRSHGLIDPVLDDFSEGLDAVGREYEDFGSIDIVNYNIPSSGSS